MEIKILSAFSVPIKMENTIVMNKKETINFKEKV